ncbi:hypothetical protein [Acinetobacter bereziniae]|uniref:hypothetical protein n=1 Tax=Acinetobacter bereziniae TaxID=106648 RepID=UPI003570BC70
MISEVTFSKLYTSFWNSLLINSKNYVRLVNGALIEDIHKPILSYSSKYNAYINILSFELYEKSLDKGNLVFTQEEIDSACKYSFDKVSSFTSFYKNAQVPPYSEIKSEVNFILESLTAQYKHKSPIIRKPLEGLGILNHSEVDLMYSSTLVEIKSGDRKFKTLDFRQVITYLTQNYYSLNSVAIDRIELFNPRMGILFNTDIETMIYELTVLTPIEVYEEVKNYLCEHPLSANDVVR